MAASAANPGVMREMDFERLNGRPAATSPALQRSATISYISPQSRLGMRDTTYYTGDSLLGSEGITVADWREASANGTKFNWSTLGAFGMGMQGANPNNALTLVGRRMVVSANGVTPLLVNPWQGPGAMNWTMFPVVYKVPGAYAVIPFVCMISQVRMEFGPPQSGLVDGRKPNWQVLPTMIRDGITFFVDVSHVNMDNWDAQMSVIAALNVYFPRNAQAGNYYLLLQPFGEISQVRTWQRQAGLNKSPDDDYIHLQASGASLGLAVAACCIGLPSLMYTGYTSNIARRLTLPSRKSKFNGQGELIGAIQTSGTSDWVETVQDVDFKVGWAFANGYPIVIPMVDALTSMNMAKVIENLTNAYTVWYSPPKGSNIKNDTITSQVWGSGPGIAQTLGQYAMFANNRDLTLYTASDAFSSGKYMSERGIVLAAGSLSEALIVSFAAAVAYTVRPDFEAINPVQQAARAEIRTQLENKVKVLDEVDIRKKVAAKAKREEKKKAGIKPKKSTPKPKRAAPAPASLSSIRRAKTEQAMKSQARAKEAATRAASAMRATPMPSQSAAPMSVGADASPFPTAPVATGLTTAIRSAPGLSKELAYAQMMSHFLDQRQGTEAAKKAAEYYEVMGTRHDYDRITPFQRTGVVRTRPGEEYQSAAAAAAAARAQMERDQEDAANELLVRQEEERLAAAEEDEKRAAAARRGQEADAAAAAGTSLKGDGSGRRGVAAGRRNGVGGTASALAYYEDAVANPNPGAKHPQEEKWRRDEQALLAQKRAMQGTASNFDDAFTESRRVFPRR